MFKLICFNWCHLPQTIHYTLWEFDHGILCPSLFSISYCKWKLIFNISYIKLDNEIFSSFCWKAYLPRKKLFLSRTLIMPHDFPQDDLVVSNWTYINDGQESGVSWYIHRYNVVSVYNSVLKNRHLLFMVILLI